MRIKPRRLYLFISVLLAVTCYFVVLSIVAENREHNLSITVGEAPFQAFALFYIAMENGYFDDENLTVNRRKFDLGKDALDDTIKGGSDIAFVFESPFIRQAQAGHDLVILSSLHKSRTGTAIVARKDRNIYYLPDLKEKTVGVVRGTNSEFLLLSLLETNHININDIQIVYADPDKLVNMYKTGKLDAICIFQPYLLDAQKYFETGSTTTFYSTDYIETSVIAGKRKVAVAKREEIIRFLKALARADEFSKNNKKSSIQIVSKAVQKNSTTTVEVLWPSYELTLTLDNVLVEIFNRESLTMQQLTKQNSPPLDFRKYVFSEYLKQVGRKYVTVFEKQTYEDKP